MIAWQLAKRNEPLVLADLPLGDLKPGYARVKVAGCGLCHTDLGFIYDDVRMRHELPLVLGHEISGTVAEGSLTGKQVLIPAVIPCRTCAPCLAGQPRICSNQLMPGNDIHGGFAEYIDVPEKELAVIPQEVDQDVLAQMSVIADAVTTPLQAIKNLGLKKGDVAIFIGVGGVGGFGALLALAFGAEVFALDINDQKLEKLGQAGVKHTLNVRENDIRATKKWVKEVCKAEGLPGFGHKIFETSGSAPGQELAFALINMGAQMATVGFTMDKLNLRISNLMAFDARIVGNWGASPEIYAEAIQLYLEGKLNLKDFTELHPLSSINEIIYKAHHEGLESRAVLVP
ncbi:MAG: 6-hydroxycyclohex-1-ene-1-carbonyl-CoA dehydrogenase [Deltaproteobacteria bacterium]|jgi:6-hydroxycyclohex-1-ene-1-carbonyl-CoA dehydrogenase|nr:6-hydroxycyclohex-1-ene-1-carbonyl-CoA dehydrogenase [Deltaproteobacteria bacterium]MBT4644205.1 6-hydroxycyclohex-1-ene-1-carbonyl-CoA dehydrogenase [Deltaproteobacteria bacterium]MBT6500469.1 6-hydroxycyclohex-1-ene-1-carbonyl-CoA dehydrogenase [Deltaproteobacteria bacterium]MBT6612387.1 6-hydroxycyclohex-1-ene-1-carbonyl-CoA dehydrogenase [Deltaproteobacteria bacterium]MBT7154724.1 6-hydroxycyclohex-1-ene-1-carbonyl-CoA dehydrogenase [Deltaproteobacteria bacterium]